jgi:hypothetical protein
MPEHNAPEQKKFQPFSKGVMDVSWRSKAIVCEFNDSKDSTMKNYNDGWNRKQASNNANHKYS